MKPTDRQIREVIDRMISNAFFYSMKTAPGEFVAKKVSPQDREILLHAQPKHFDVRAK